MNIPEGSAAQQVLLHGITKKKYRGECCAGDAPPALPSQPVVNKGRDEAFFTRLASLGPDRTRGALKSMASQYLPHHDD